MIYSIQHIASIIHSKTKILFNSEIEYLLIDSRKIVFPNQSLFFALKSERRNGHNFIKEVYERGVRNFVVSENIDAKIFPGANFLLVDDTLKALQTLASQHRQQFNYPVIGITGSNGKTIVKEWLNELLQPDFNIVRSPRSFNSQIGVPLSVWQMNGQNTLAIFEAGISTVGEMEKLEKIIQPTIGVLTNIGEAHNEGFKNDIEKANEKLKLFEHCNKVVVCKDVIPSEITFDEEKYFTWSRKQNATVLIEKETKTDHQTEIKFSYQNKKYSLVIPFIDFASVNNAITCTCVLLMMNYAVDVIAKRLLQLHSVEMRLQLKKGINNSTIINDSYSNDLSSLSIALNYLQQQAGENKTTVILSDIFQSGLTNETLYQHVANELHQLKISRIIGIGEIISKYQSLFNFIPQKKFYSSTENFLEQSTTNDFKDEFILLKGSRVFEFERIGHWLEQKVHRTILEINLSALVHNLKEHQKFLSPTTKLMAMVKAFSYGSGSAEIARVLQFHKVDYLTVAYADEGVELRKAGISLPIMVMNTDEAGFDAVVEYNLEPEIYSFNIYHSFHQYLQQQAITHFPVHIKVNTGMNRLGFDIDEIEDLATQLHTHQTMAVKSVLSHLAGSEDETLDYFTEQQTQLFKTACNILENKLGYTFIKHIANSAAIVRHKDIQFDMVRLGIGLYGIDITQTTGLNVETVATLKSTIAQIRNIKAGETVSYNRKGKLFRDSKIAVVRIGYADGMNRKLGNGIGSVFIKNKLAPIVGNVCMDMTMVDVTDIPGVKENDEVEVFGKNIPVEKLAEQVGTIPYEIMTSISQRVKRVYMEE